MRILLIDDDERLVSLVGTYLRERGLEVDGAPRGTLGLARVLEGGFDAVVLDVMLPDLDGFEVLRRIRAASPIPVLMLTARGEDTDRIVGLEMGADDYLAKPFNPRELLARIRAICRRGAPDSRDKEVLRFGNLDIDLQGRAVRLDGTERLLTTHQFDLLKALATQAGRVLSREQLHQAVRGEDLEAFDRSIDVHISRIRAALGAEHRWIRTVRGAGYVFSPPGTAP